MANPDHRALVQQGVEIWNAWKRTARPAPVFTADLRGADLRDRDLQGIDSLSDGRAGRRPARRGSPASDMTGALLADADLRGANLSAAHFHGAHLNRAQLIEVSAIVR